MKKKKKKKHAVSNTIGGTLSKLDGNVQPNASAPQPGPHLPQHLPD